MESTSTEAPLDGSAPPTLEDLLRFERLLSHTAARLLNVAPEELDATIQVSVSALGVYLGAERGGIALFSEDGGSLAFQYGYFAPGVKTDLFDMDLARALPWYGGELRAGRPVIVPHAPEGVPVEAPRGTRSHCGHRDQVQHHAAPEGGGRDRGRPRMGLPRHVPQLVPGVPLPAGAARERLRQRAL